MCEECKLSEHDKEDVQAKWVKNHDDEACSGVRKVSVRPANVEGVLNEGERRMTTLFADSTGEQSVGEWRWNLWWSVTMPSTTRLEQ